MDVSKTTPAASTARRRGTRNYAEYTVSLSSRTAQRALALIGGVGQECDVASALEGSRQAALVPGAGPGHATR